MIVKNLTSGSIWGPVRTTALEINSRKITTVLIHTNFLLREKDMIIQVNHELLVDGDNSMSIPEVTYRWK